MIERPRGMSDEEYMVYLEKCKKFEQERKDSQRPRIVTEKEAPVAIVVALVVVLLLLLKTFKG